MSDYINFHKKNLIFKFFVRLTINLSTLFPAKIYTYFWNTALSIINNSVRINLSKNNTFLINDSKYKIEIGYKKRFEYYMQNISHRYDHLAYEYMFSNINFTNNDLIIDCGANIGEIYLALNHYSENLKFKYFGFEPNNYDFQILQRNTNNLVIEPLALYSQNIQKEFYLKGSTADSSFENSRFGKKIIVNCVTLDSQFTNKEKIKLLKLEAEGFEYDVIRGAVDNLKNIEYISADLSFELDNNTKSSYYDVNKYLEENNFQLLSENPRLVYLYKNKSF